MIIHAHKSITSKIHLAIAQEFIYRISVFTNDFSLGCIVPQINNFTDKLLL